MTWFDAVILILWAMGLLILIGLGRKLEAKLDATLNLVQSLTGPKNYVADGLEEVRKKEDKSVILLTPERDAKLLGDEGAD